MTQHQFNWYYQNLREENREATNWLDNIPKEKWALAFDQGRRYGHMTTNLAECINSVLKGTRNLPITSIVQSIYYRLAELFVKKGQQQHAMINAGREYSEVLTRTMDDNRRKANSHIVRSFTRENQEFLVEELVNPLEGRPAGKFKVNLKDTWCDCGKFQTLHFPCSHVIAACASVHVDYMQFVDPVYKLENIFNVYRQEFQVVGNEGYWPQYDGPQLLHNPEMQRARHGRPRSTRIRTEMDMREEGHPKHCSLCKSVGHSRRTCPNRGSSSAGTSQHE